MKYTVFAWHSRVNKAPFYIGYDLTEDKDKPRKDGREVLPCEHWRRSLANNFLSTIILQTDSELEAFTVSTKLVYLVQTILHGCNLQDEAKPEEIPDESLLYQYLPELKDYKENIQEVFDEDLEVSRKVKSRINMYKKNRERNKQRRNHPREEVVKQRITFKEAEALRKLESYQETVDNKDIFKAFIDHGE